MRQPLSVVMRLVFAGIILLGSGVEGMAQAPPIQWQHVLGGSQSEEASVIYQLAGGGYVIAGHTGSDDGDVSGLHGSQLDFWIVKTDENGIMNWQRTYGGSNAELGVSFVQAFDGGFVLAGYSFSDDGDVSVNHGNCDYWVVKLDDSGGIQWQRSLGGSNIDIPKAVIQTHDGGFVVVGWSQSTDGDVSGAHDSADCWVVKLSAFGATQWQKCLGGSRGDGAVDVVETRDSGLILACTTSSVDEDVTVNHGAADAWIVKLSFSGVLLWEKSLGGSGTDFANKILQTTDSGYIVCGSSNSTDGDLTVNHGGFDYWVVKLSRYGVIQWQKSFGGSDDEFAYSIKRSMDGGYVVAGTTFSFDGDVSGNAGISDQWIVKLSSTGILEWTRTLGGNGYDGANCIIQATDSGYVVAGRSASDDVCTGEYHGSNDFLITKLRDIVGAVGVGTVPSKESDRVSVLPNPSNNFIDIGFEGVIHDLKIMDLLGRIEFMSSPDARHAGIDISCLKPGMHVVTVNNFQTARFLKGP